MSVATVCVGGVPLDLVAPVSDLEDSTIWRLEGFSGDYEATFRFGADRWFSAQWFHSGATVEIREGGLPTWRGFLGEPSPSDGGWNCKAFGDGADAVNYRFTGATSADIDTAVADAATRGMRWSRGPLSFVPSVSVTLSPADMAVQMDVALDRALAVDGKVWYVSRGVGWLRTAPTGVDWMMAPDSTYLGVTDENYITALSAMYATAVDSMGNPTAVSFTTPTASISPYTLDTVAAARMGGAREAVIDLTALGVLTLTNARYIAGNRFTHVGARAGFTNAFEMTALNSWRYVNGQPAPMNVRAGDRIRIPGITDMTASSTFGTSVTVTAGKVTRNHTEQRVVVEPVGLVPRDFVGALAAAQKPQSQVVEL